jgi:DNA-binding MarR family transcriptional regulator
MPISPPRVPKDVLRTWLSVVRAYNLCDAVLSQRLALLQVRVAEHEILANLLREPGLSQQTLSARCFTAKSHMSALLDTLEARRWVRRDVNPADARSRLLVLTRAGTAMAKRTVAIQTAVVNEMTTSIHASELAAIESVMERASSRLEAIRG